MKSPQPPTDHLITCGYWLTLRSHFNCAVLATGLLLWCKGNLSIVLISLNLPVGCTAREPFEFEFFTSCVGLYDRVETYLEGVGLSGLRAPVMLCWNLFVWGRGSRERAQWWMAGSDSSLKATRRNKEWTSVTSGKFMGDLLRSVHTRRHETIVLFGNMCHGDKLWSRERHMDRWALCFGAKNKTLRNNRIGGCRDDSWSWGNPCHILLPKS